MKQTSIAVLVLFALLTACGGGEAPLPESYETLLKGGHVIDPKNDLSAPRDIAISGGKIVAVRENLPEDRAGKVVDVSGLYVTPGLIDLHAHVYAGTGIPGVLTGDSSVYPDHFSFRSGCTTLVDVGSSGHRNFEDFKDRVIDGSKTRVLVLLNVAGGGMGVDGEDNPADMEPEKIAAMIKKYPEIIVGIKTAHYPGPEWVSVERAVEAANLANVPVMVDFGGNHPDARPIGQLFLDKLRPGDIYTHMYSGLRVELTDEGKINPSMFEGRKRGIIFDVGHGGGSFTWRVAVPAYKEGFPPDTISTDLHTGSMNDAMKDMTNVMSKILNLGSSIEDVVRMSTWKPAEAIKRPELGHLSEGAIADVTVLRLDEGDFGFLDVKRITQKGNKLLTAELTLKDGNVAWDLNGRAGEDWETFYAREENRADR
ncbi:MAG: amidohydrolase/deacetylase family metallohydrolase [Acidobacteria bacterium]|nr:amidohydrolase/deacetylase family metallohydrolase [Acidobacteriota bacterium]